MRNCCSLARTLPCPLEGMCSCRRAPHAIRNRLSLLQVPWTDKNNDTLQAEWTARFASSEIALLKELFLEEYEKSQKDKKSSSFSSVGKRFVNDLNSLLTELQTSRATFIRCVKPNAEQVHTRVKLSLMHSCFYNVIPAFLPGCKNIHGNHGSRPATLLGSDRGCPRHA